jgi:hypothetical protein
MKTTLTLAAALLLTLTSTAARAGSPHDIDNVADALARQTALLTRIVERDFRRTPHYRHLVEDMREMAAHAEHVHDVVHHHPARIGHLQKDVNELHRVVVHVERLINDIKADLRHGTRRHVRTIGHGHITLSVQQHSVTMTQVRRLERALDDVHDAVDDLENCLRHMQRRAGHHHALPPRRSAATIGLPLGRLGYIRFRIQ